MISAGRFSPSEPRKETRRVEFNSLLHHEVVERVSRVDHLRDEVLDAPFERRYHLLTIPEGTPISGELRGKQAMVDHLMNVGDLLEFR